MWTLKDVHPSLLSICKLYKLVPFQIWLNVTAIDIKGTGRKCTGDKILVAAVMLSQNKVLPVEVLCGNTVPDHPIIVASRLAYIGFRSDNALTGRGFRIAFSAKVPVSSFPTAPETGPTPSPNKPGMADVYQI